MEALCDANDFISRDEAVHWSFAATVYKTMVEDGLIEKIKPEIARQMMEEAIEVESRFVRDILPVSMIGMNSSSMIQYIKAQADNVSAWFDLPPIYNERNPFEFMNMLDIPKKNNFFERTGTSYVKAHGHIDFDNQEF
jgi:ribonucleotide reductase beta subunit family protein with ferritin-like domain